MASWSGEGGSSPPPAPSAAPVGGDWNWNDLLEKQRAAYQLYVPGLETYAAVVDPKKAQAQSLKIAQNINHQELVTSDYGTKSGELDWRHVTELLLDMFGYGAAIASFVPNPATRIGGQLGASLSGAARRFSRGDVQGGVTALARTSGALYRNVGRYQRTLQKNKNAHRK